MDGSDLVNKLHTSTRYFRSALKEAGFDLKVLRVVSRFISEGYVATPPSVVRETTIPLCQ